MTLIRYLFLLCLFCNSVESVSQSISLSNSTDLYNPPVSFFITDEETSNLKNAILKNKDQFQIKRGRLLFSEYGLHEELWLYTQLKNNSSQKEWFIVFDNPLIDKIHVF